MRKVAIVLLVLITHSLAPGIQQHNEWIRYKSLEGRYSVLLPSQPEIGTQEATAATGEKFTQYKASVFDSGVAYMIGYFDYQGGTVFTVDKARDGMIEALKGTLLNEELISLGGFSGRQFRVLAKDSSGAEYIIRARIHDIDQRVYVLQFVVPKSTEAENADKAARYFDSFQITKTP